MIAKIWTAWFDSPHKVMFSVLVVLVAMAGWAYVGSMAAGTINELTIQAFKVLLTEASVLAGIIAGAAKIEGVAKSAAEGVAAVFKGVTAPAAPAA